MKQIIITFVILHDSFILTSCFTFQLTFAPSSNKTYKQISTILKSTWTSSPKWKTKTTNLLHLRRNLHTLIPICMIDECVWKSNQRVGLGRIQFTTLACQLNFSFSTSAALVVVSFSSCLFVLLNFQLDGQDPIHFYPEVLFDARTDDLDSLVKYSIELGGIQFHFR